MIQQAMKQVALLAEESEGIEPMSAYDAELAAGVLSELDKRFPYGMTNSELRTKRRSAIDRTRRFEARRTHQRPRFARSHDRATQFGRNGEHQNQRRGQEILTGRNEKKNCKI